MSNTFELNLSSSARLFQVYRQAHALKRLSDSDFYTFNKWQSCEENLQQLAVHALASPAITLSHLYAYRDIFLDTVSRWISNLDSTISPAILDALARIISLAPESTTLAELYLQRHHEHVTCVLQTATDEHVLLPVLLAYYRLLYHDKERFSTFVRPQVLHAILDKNVSSLVKYMTIKVLSEILDMSETSISQLVAQNCDAFTGVYESDRDIDYTFLELHEAKRLSNFTKLPAHDDAQSKDKIYPVESFSTFVVSICGVLVPKITAVTETTETELVANDKSVAALRNLARAVQKSQPVLLAGKAGSGKTFLINELSKFMSAASSIVKIHLGEQTDAKLLLGTYTSGDKPGTFEWRSGVLTTAVKEGRWVLIEDIDKAPTEVLSVLLTLLEKRELILPSRGEVIKAANGFQMISTIRIDDNDTKWNIPDLIGLRLWETIRLEEPSESDLLEILRKKYPILTHMVPKFIKTYNAVHKIYHMPSFVSLNKGAHPRVVSVRDLVKFCHRANLLLQTHGITTANHLIESSVYDEIFAEATDCFSSAISEIGALEVIINAIGEALEVPSSRILLHLQKHVPQLQESDSIIQIGRAQLTKAPALNNKKSVNSTSFARTNHSLRLMEQIGVSIQMCEPVLLVGETGTGKTTVVQQVAKMMNKNLTVINVSQQTESGDLLGGYKPVNAKSVSIPIQEEFESLFGLTFSMKKNEKFYNLLHKCFNKNKWKNVVKLWQEAFKMAKTVLTKEDEEEKQPQKKRKLNAHEKKLLLDKWVDFAATVKHFERNAASMENSFVFNFVEGSLVKAVRNGDWLLLDEINLASADTLESIADLLTDAATRSILLSEKGEAESIRAHPDFRIFACMNPATDVGKRDLPVGIRSRFSEIYVHSPDGDITDLLQIIDKYIGRFAVSDEWCGNDIAELYLEAKRLAESNQIVDGSNQKPHFSIRTLTRTLLYVCDIVGIYGLRRSLYEGFCMAFLTLLDEKSEKLLKPLIEKFTIGRLKNANSVMKQAPPSPGDDYVQFRHYWMKRGPSEIKEQPQYIITPFVEKNMLNLVRATSGSRFPVLVQGPTSAGKTSMIKYLADITGHKFVRINNHEHTDLQEYLGTYVTDDTGKLSFREGVLVEALRNGHWIVLDELNLAPTDVLEALNRLLDDNRELFIPETQEVIHPHPDFMLFATQNPPGLYGGRKVLSRAFRNRFLELHFDDIPQDELEIILRERCQIAPSYAKKIVEVYRQLSINRSANRLFEQKNSFATLRDLFRWALREAVGYEQLAANGYMLLAERCRKPEEKLVVKSVLESVMKVSLDMDAYYASLENHELLQLPSSVVWTKAMRRLAVLVSTCLANNEPILLVGETGCGKTTVCQLIAQYMGKQLIAVNAHQNTETGDILGAQRPVRNRSEMQANLAASLRAALNNDDVDASLDELIKLYDQATDIDEETRASIKEQRDALNVLFEWCDGPLIQALKTGQFFLLDEISLADDSVLERLNSVLEPERSLLLAEKGTEDSFITASDGFEFLATMNPGGDYGKKELSPALRNRFTEVWVPSMEDFKDVHQIVSAKLLDDRQSLADSIVEFSEWYGKKFGGGSATNGVISLRDILAWVEFINSAKVDQYQGLVHGAAMVFVDSLGTNNTAYLAENEDKLRIQKADCIRHLSKLCGQDLLPYYECQYEVSVTNESVKCGLFELARKENGSTPSFNLQAPTTAANLMRVIRAMQVHKPILLEGSPGVGKTSLISALASSTGNALTRINLSEQTDLVDLFGSDAPGEKTGEFVWRDAPFLRAMQRGEWVLLDEMNLASQSVLEGLNACLDHRGEAYIPELDKSFTCHPNFLVFAAQNPQYQGGGRKGLPKSFVNRFSVVYVDMLTAEDLLMIAQHLYPQIDADTCSKMISIMSTLEKETTEKQWGTLGAPWEFNLRDTLRWLQLYTAPSIVGDIQPSDFLKIIVTQRFRTEQDRLRAQELISSVFGEQKIRRPLYELSSESMQIGGEVLNRKELIQFSDNKTIPLQSNYKILESVVRCIKHNWPLILVGPTNAGKTDLIRFMGASMGTKVVEFAMNSDIDSMDILGGYEQVDLTRKVSNVLKKLTLVLRELLVINLQHTTPPHVLAAGLKLFDFITNEDCAAQFDKLYTSFNEFQQLFNNEQLELLADELAFLKTKLDEDASVKFEWFDGLLVKAVEEGDWLILDNANLCSPSVLDRLNSLLETNGSLIVNECSMEDGQPRLVKPHPNFRLFLTMDPKFGELSRAMRNRGIEIYMESLDDRATEFDREALAQKALASFLPAKNSKMAPFVQIHDINNTNAVTILKDTSLVRQWSATTLASTDFSENVDPMCNMLIWLQSQGLLSQLQSLSPNIMPLLNEYLLSNLPESVKSCEPMYLFEVVKHCLEAANLMEQTKVKAVNGKLNELSYLEQSAAVSQGRNIKNKPTWDIFNFLVEVQQYLTISTSPLFQDQYADLFRIWVIWFGCYDTAATKDEAKLRVYQDLFKETPVAPIVEKYASSLNLTSGWSMTLLWETFRHIYPSSREAWDMYNKMVETSEKFDAVSFTQFSDSYDHINDLRAVLLTLHEDLLNGDTAMFEEVINKMDAGITQLDSISAGFLIKRNHYLQEQFRLLYNFCPKEELITYTGVKFEELTNKSVLPNLWPKENNKFGSQTSSLFNGDLLESSLVRTKTMQQIPGFQLTQALTDGKKFVESLVKFSDNVLEDQVSKYSKVLRDWYAQVVACHVKDGEEIANCGHVEFIRIHEQFLGPSTLDHSSINALGKSWVLFATGLIQLFVPSSPYDPAIYDYVKFDDFNRFKNASLEIIESWRSVGNVIAGEKLFLETLLPNEFTDPEKPRVFRPESSIDPLFEEWSAFMNSTIDVKPVEALLNSLDERHLVLFQQNSSQFIERLKHFSVYSDLNDVFVSYIMAMKFGFDLLSHKTETISPLWSIDMMQLTNVNKIETVFQVLMTQFKEQSIDSFNVDQIMSYFISVLGKDGNIDAVLQSLYYRWSLRRMKEEQERQQDSIFKYSDQDNIEEDFKRMFPDYEDVMTVDGIKSSSEMTLDDVYFDLAKRYMTVFNSDNTSLSSLIEQGSKVSQLLTSFDLTGTVDPSQLAAVVKLMSQELGSFTKSNSKDLDFYRGFSVVESAKAIRVMEKLLASVHLLLKQWPEHSTLIDLFRITQEFLEFPSDTTLARYLQKVEQIYTFVSEWQKYASSQVSLQAHVDEITALIVSWRKLELTTWNSLFAFEDLQQERKIGKWWFHLYESIIVSETGSGLLTSLNIFFSKCSIGEFPVRLQLAKSFINHIKLRGGETDSLSNIVTFYEQFVPAIEEHVARERKSLEKQIHDVILLASWKDVNVDALKQSSRRSHNNLYKVVRKYRDLLSAEVTTYIEQGLSTKVSANSDPIRVPHFKAVNDASRVIEVPTWSSRTKTLSSAKLSNTMATYVADIREQEFPTLLPLAKELNDEAERLKKETPSSLTKENKKEVAALRIQKDKALSDALKEFRRIGLKTRFREDIKSLQSSVTSILANSKSFKETELNGSDAYFFRILELMPRLRNAVASPKEFDCERGMAVAENLIFSLIATREPLLKLVQSFEQLDGLRFDLEHVATTENRLQVCNVGLLKFMSHWLPQVIDFSLETLSLVAPGDYGWLSAAKQQVSSLWARCERVHTTQTSVVLEEFQQMLSKLCERLDAGNFICKNISTWIRAQSIEDAEMAESCDLGEMDEMLRKISTSVLLSVQKLHGLRQEISEEDDKWLSSSQKLLMSFAKILNNNSTVVLVEQFVGLMKSRDFTHEESQLVNAMVSFTTPLINEFYTMLSVVLNKLKTNYVEMSRATFILCTLLYNLASKGFCTPEAPQEEKEDDNLQDGTGLGDGEGAQTNNNDVEEDDDLTEHAQQPNDQKNEDEDEQDDAVDMQGDMAGELEEASDQEKEDNEDEDGEDEQEMDEEVDDIDDLDPNAIDEKMWDEESKEQEKDSDKMPENSKQDDAQAAEDEPEDSNEDKKDDGESNEGQDEQPDNEDDQDAEDEEDVGEQEDEVRNDDNEKLEDNVPETETMDLPEDMNLDSGDEDEKEESEEEFHDAMDEDEPTEDKKDGEAEADVEEEADEDAEEEAEDEDMEAGENEEDNEDEEDTENIDGETNIDEEKDLEDEAQDSESEALDESKKDAGGEDEANDEDNEGLDGVDDLVEQEDIDNEAAVQQKSGNKGDGADAQDEEEQEDMGATGSAQTAQQEQAEEETVNEASRDEAKESLKQLGDSLKEFHKRRQEIQESSQQNEAEESANVKPEEFEHVDGDNTNNDTQALGAANKDQVSSIDDDMAIEESDDEPEIKQEEPSQEQGAEEEDENAETQTAEDVDAADNNGKSKGAVIGERKAEHESGAWGEIDEDIEMEDEIEEIEREEEVVEDVAPRDLEESRALWRQAEIETQELASGLSEQLRLILEPTLATKLRGDYKTGKRLNMKRIIPYIASQFRKDKIWLRRTKPSKRQYQIMIAVDDSKSMSESKSVDLAFQSICLVSKALTQLESGGLSIVKFGGATRELHPFNKQFSADSGAHVFQWFDFQDTRTDVKKLVSESIKIFESAQGGSEDLWKLEIIISDGVCEDHATIQRLVRRAREQKIMLVFVIIDGINNNESIMDMSQVKYVTDAMGNMNLQVDKYLDTFPFEFYVVVSDITELPEMLAVILRQYFSEMASA